MPFFPLIPPIQISALFKKVLSFFNRQRLTDKFETSVESLLEAPNNLATLEQSEKQVFSRYPSLIPIKCKRALISTEQYNFLFPLVTENFLNDMEILPLDWTINQYEEKDTQYNKVKGVTIRNNQTQQAFNFAFTYGCEWLCNNQHFHLPNQQDYINKLVMASYEQLARKNELEKSELLMTNLERLKLEVEGIDFPDEKLSIYLQESDLQPQEEYNPASNSNKRKIYETAVSALNALANNPTLLKDYKLNDTTISNFSKNLQNRIEQLNNQIRTMASTDDEPSNFFNLFG